MPFQVSPGVNVTEVDLTTVIPAVSTSIGAAVGAFIWGPAEQIVQIGSEDELVDNFGKPTTNTAVDFFSAANFLSYSGHLKVVRVANTGGTFNASDNSIGAIQINNDNVWDETVSQIAANTFYAKYPGELGNSLTVEWCDGGEDIGTGNGFSAFTSNTLFSSAPGTSPYVSARGGANDEIHVVVKDDGLGTISGSPSAVLEYWGYLSKAEDALSAGGDVNYYRDVINNKSQYIRVGTDLSLLDGAGPTGSQAVDTDFGISSASTGNGFGSSTLSGGASGSSGSGVYGADDYLRAWDLFADSATVDVSLVIAGEGGKTGTKTEKKTVIKYISDNVTDKRKDAVMFFSPHLDAVDSGLDSGKLADVIGFRTGAFDGPNLNTSYAVMDSGWKYQYDKYNDKYRWVPLNGDIAGLCARTDNNRDAWWSPAGYNRGQVKNVVKLAFNPQKAARDSLYQKQVNPVVTFPGQGTILFGDKTQQTRPSAFDRINVRRLFIVLEKAISTAAKFSLFEFNDEFTRAQFRNMVEPFLRDIQGRRGIIDFKVVCDETNNTGQVIDTNQFIGDIYIKPARSINFIQLNFIAVSTGVDFSEIVGKF